MGGFPPGEWGKFRFAEATGRLSMAASGANSIATGFDQSINPPFSGFCGLIAMRHAPTYSPRLPAGIPIVETDTAA